MGNGIGRVQVWPFCISEASKTSKKSLAVRIWNLNSYLGVLGTQVVLK